MRKKTIIMTIVILIALLLFMSWVKIHAYNEAKVSEKLWISFPRNLAVFHILVVLSPSGEEMKERFPHPLAAEAQEYFRDFKDHPAVMMTDKMFKQMWYFALNYIALYYSDFPEAQLTAEIPEEYQEWRDMKNMIQHYLSTVREFYLASDFEKFWKSRRQDIQALIEEVKDNLPSIDIPQLLEDFYGREVERFCIVPCPFMAQSATHVEVQDKEGNWRFYHLDGGLGFQDSFSSVYFAFHEFSHSFIEPISLDYSEQINKLAYLYEPLKEDFSRMGYRDWDRAFAEHMVTAGQLHLVRKAFGEEKAKKMMQREIKKGFKLLPHFYAYFDEYDKNRDKYKNLKAFYPLILTRLSQIDVEK